VSVLSGKSVQPRDLLPSVFPKMKKKRAGKKTAKKELKDIKKRLKIE
jgi:hypothetical protein